MDRKIVLVTTLYILLFFFFALGCLVSESEAQENVIKLQNAKLPAVSFSHATHVEKQKIDCAACHHKQPAKPQACTTCHKIEAQGITPSAKEAFHRNCLNCHKEQAGKGRNAPTKCNDCHKR